MEATQITEAFVRTTGIPPRAADLQALELIAGGEVTAEVVAEYLWDHWLGEPESPTQAEVEAVVREAING